MNRIGTDESGKGDYFGPLVAAAAYVELKDEEFLKSIGVRDSKKISDKKIHEIADEIRKNIKHDIVRINPEKYNKLYSKFGNLNVLLAWAHARAIENLLKKVKCQTVISDQFGDEKYLREKLMEEGRKINLIQRPRAEEDLAVAAASILARDSYLKGLKELGEKHGIKLPKGATHVEETGGRFISENGVEKLNQIAKTHFKTTEKIKTFIA